MEFSTSAVENDILKLDCLTISRRQHITLAISLFTCDNLCPHFSRFHTHNLKNLEITLRQFPKLSDIFSGDELCIINAGVINALLPAEKLLSFDENVANRDAEMIKGPRGEGKSFT